MTGIPEVTVRCPYCADLGVTHKVTLPYVGKDDSYSGDTVLQFGGSCEGEEFVVEIIYSPKGETKCQKE